MPVQPEGEGGALDREVTIEDVVRVAVDELDAAEAEEGVELSATVFDNGVDEELETATALEDDEVAEVSAAEEDGKLEGEKLEVATLEDKGVDKDGDVVVLGEDGEKDKMFGMEEVVEAEAVAPGDPRADEVDCMLEIDDAENDDEPFELVEELYTTEVDEDDTTGLAETDGDIVAEVYKLDEEVVMEATLDTDEDEDGDGDKLDDDDELDENKPAVMLKLPVLEVEKSIFDCDNDVVEADEIVTLDGEVSTFDDEEAELRAVEKEREAIVAAKVFEVLDAKLDDPDAALGDLDPVLDTLLEALGVLAVEGLVVDAALDTRLHDVVVSGSVCVDLRVPSLRFVGCTTCVTVTVIRAQATQAP